MSRAATRLILTCEHGGNRVPVEYKHLFRGRARLVRSHRGWDVGALDLARTFQRGLSTHLCYATTTRLLVDLNRSLGHRRLFSEVTMRLPQADKERILAKYYYPHRGRVEAWIARQVSRGYRTIHLSCHTFVPRLAGITRTADVGLLYDPGRSEEGRLCAGWKSALGTLRGDLRVKRNYPYRGTADGFTTYLRRRFPDHAYAGIELEVNGRWPVLMPAAAWRALRRDLVTTLAASAKLLPTTE
jgi:predicted N-formylglutamate amidohydrolase